jgi:hypothetical protein
MSIAEKLRPSETDTDAAADKAARIGLFARGSLYVVVGMLAARVALGDHNEEADRKGAIDAIARQPMGKVLLVALIIGLVGYGLWRLSRAFRRDPDENAGKRVGHVLTAGLYGFYAAACVAKLVGTGGGGEGGGGKEQDLTAKVLNWPFGPAIVIGAGLGCWVVACWRLYRATGDHLEENLESGIDERVRTAVVWLGRVGHVATAAAFGLIGWFLIQAGRDHNPGEAKGLDDALKHLVGRPHGPLLLLLVAFGFVAFGLWCFAESKYRSPSET